MVILEQVVDGAGQHGKVAAEVDTRADGCNLQRHGRCLSEQAAARGRW